MTADTYGSTISARTSDEGTSPNPVYSIPSRDSTLCKRGQRTNNPHIPYMTLGIAASRSSACATGTATFGGAAFTKSAAAKASGTAMRSASRVVAAVPTRAPAAPKEPSAGFHSAENTSEKPAVRNASMDSLRITATSAIATASPTIAPALHNQRNAVSVSRIRFISRGLPVISRLECSGACAPCRRRTVCTMRRNRPLRTSCPLGCPFW